MPDVCCHEPQLLSIKPTNACMVKSCGHPTLPAKLIRHQRARLPLLLRSDDLAVQMFDELLLLKTGGRVIYSGPLGHESTSLVRSAPSPFTASGQQRDTSAAAHLWVWHCHRFGLLSRVLMTAACDEAPHRRLQPLAQWCSQHMLTQLSMHLHALTPTLRGRYFESIQGVPKISEGYNPATWMLDISTISSEQRMGVNLADVYQDSQQRRWGLHVCACQELGWKMGDSCDGSKWTQQTVRSVALAVLHPVTGQDWWLQAGSAAVEGCQSAWSCCGAPVI